MPESKWRGEVDVRRMRGDEAMMFEDSQYKIGSKNQMKKTNPPAMFAVAHQGVADGFPIALICPQSKVIMDIPAP